MLVRTFATALLFAVGATPLVATPRDDCALIVSALGFSIEDYAFEKGGVFSMDRHQFGSLTCYVNNDGAFDSLYRGEVPVAEDGYFGEEALRERDRLLAYAALSVEEADEQRDREITLARWAHEMETRRIERQLQAALTALRAASDPLSETAAMQTAPLADEPLEPPDTEIQDGATQVAEAASDEAIEMWVTAEHLAIRSCPSTDCGQMSTTIFGNRQIIYEERDGWGRISEPYGAACNPQGLSDMIDSGNRRCEPENGIVDGQVAQWASLRYMTDVRPEDPAASATGDALLVASSDNYAMHGEAFIVAARRLLDEGTCTEDDFLEIGGFFWAPSQGTDGYGIYCGGTHVSNRIYLNVETGEIYR